MHKDLQMECIFLISGDILISFISVCLSVCLSNMVVAERGPCSQILSCKIEIMVNIYIMS